MSSLTIDNEDLTDQLRAIAARENRSIEEILSALVEQYDVGDASKASADVDSDDQVKRLRQLAYERARQFWRQAGHEERASLMDTQLAERFWGFDENDIPRLKSDDVEAHPHSLKRLGQIAREADIIVGASDVSERADEILRDEYADYLLRRMNRQDDDASTR